MQLEVECGSYGIASDLWIVGEHFEATVDQVVVPLRVADVHTEFVGERVVRRKIHAVAATGIFLQPAV